MTETTPLDDESRQAFAQWDDDEKESRSTGEVRVYQTQHRPGRGRGTTTVRSDQKKPGRGGQHRPPSEEALREKEDPHYGKPPLSRILHLDARTEEIIISILHDDEARANLSRDTLKDLPGREDFQAVLVLASYRGKQYFRGTRTELSTKFIFESTDTLIHLIKDDSAMESTVSKLNLNRRKPIPNELTRLIDFDGVLGDDVLKALDSANTPDERRSAMLMGLRRALLRFYGQTLETYAVYKTAESQSLTQLSQYFHSAQKFARQLVWPHTPSPRWNPPALPVRDYHTIKGKSSRENKSSASKPPRAYEDDVKTSISDEEQSIGSSSTALRRDISTPSNKYDSKDGKSVGFIDSEQAILQPNLVINIDANKLLTMNEAANKKFCGEKLRSYIDQYYPARSERLLHAVEQASVADLQQMIFGKGHLEQKAKELGIFPRMTIQQSPVKKVQAPRNSTEVSYLLSIERKNCAQRNIFATLMSILKAIKPIVEGFGHPLTIHPVQQATDDPTIYDLDGLEEMKADLEGRYVTNISTEGWGNTLKFRIRVATTLDLIYMLNRTADYNVTPTETLEKHLSKLSTVVSVLSQDRCSRTGIIGIAGSTQLDHRPKASHEIIKLLKQEANFDIAPDKFVLLSGKAQFPDEMVVPHDFTGCAEQVNCLIILSDDDIAEDLRAALLSIDMPYNPSKGYQEIWNYTFFPLFPRDEDEGKQQLRGIERQCTFIIDTIRVEIFIYNVILIRGLLNVYC